jgi:hypothetical protein
MAEKVIKYKCEHCGELFDSEQRCISHEDRHTKIHKANEMLNGGCSLKEIQDVLKIWGELPKYLENVNKDNCFAISYWQCCDKPAYTIKSVNFSGKLYLAGCGSWSGYYGGYLPINSYVLSDPRPKEELFYDERFKKSYGCRFLI